MRTKYILSTVAARTDIGLVRNNNEDNFLLSDLNANLILESPCSLERSPNENQLLFIVSDGMGGYQNGELASKLTIRAIQAELIQLSQTSNPTTRLQKAIEEANRIVWEKSQTYTQLHMGATATVLLIEGDNAYIAEVGDSRAYIIRGRRIKQLTKDQTASQLCVDSGLLTPEEAISDVNRHILLQAVGSQELLQVPLTSIQLKYGDIFLLCSDGLFSKLRTDEMKNIIRQCNSLDAAATSLIEKAKQYGGEDNITVLLVKFEGNALEINKRDEPITNKVRILSSFTIN
ncbi:MAG: protein phosphatase 2C domain-containing protein [Acidobacteriota bacterium]